jgi:hypothetical protein
MVFRTKARVKRNLDPPDLVAGAQKEKARHRRAFVAFEAPDYSEVLVESLAESTARAATATTPATSAGEPRPKPTGATTSSSAGVEAGPPAKAPEAADIATKERARVSFFI